MYVVFVYADTPQEWNCSEWRCLAPADAINLPQSSNFKAKLLHTTGFMNYLDPVIQDWVMPADIIVFQRNLFSQQGYDAVEYWQGMGKIFTVDLDDGYSVLPWSNPAHRFWIQNAQNHETHPIVALERGLKIAENLTSPNRLILHDWKHVTRGYYLPNFARGKWWNNLPERKNLKSEFGVQDKIIIGWGGSVSHYDSWWGSGLFEAAKRISVRHPEILWTICGNDPRIFDNLPVSRHQKMKRPGVLPELWPRTVASFDIGLAPLSGAFDQRRSWLKGLEYMLGGVPWIGSVGEPYSDLSDFGILVSPDPEAWEDAIEEMIKLLPQRQEEALSRVSFARQWTIENQVETYRTTYERIINDTRTNRGRLPGILRISGTTALDQQKLSGNSGEMERKSSAPAQNGRSKSVDIRTDTIPQPNSSTRIDRARRILIASWHPLLSVAKLLPNVHWLTFHPQFAKSLIDLDLSANALGEKVPGIFIQNANNSAIQLLHEIDGVDWDLYNISQSARKFLTETMPGFLFNRLGELTLLTELLQHAQIDAVILNNDVEPVNRLAALWAEANNIPCIHIPHSIYLPSDDLDWKDTGYDIHEIVTAKRIAVSGPYQAEWYKRRTNDAEIRVTGLPQFDPWTKPNISRQQARNLLKLEEDKPFIVYASSWRQNTNLRGSHDGVEESYEAILDTISMFPDDMQWCIKLHPRGNANHQWHIEQLRQKNLKSSVFVTAEHLEVLLAAADAIIAYSSSNILIEAAHNPDTRLFSILGFQDEPDIITLNPDSEEIAIALQKELEKPSKPKDELLNKYVAFRDGKNSQRIADWIEEVCQNSQELKFKSIQAI